MPVNDHLKWVEIKDFTKGLYNAQDFLMPAEGFQTMTDCYPLAQGGVRAFFKPTTTTVSGLTSTDRIIWMDSFNTGTSLKFLLLTVTPSTGVLKAWVRDSAAGTWTLSKTWTAPSGGSAAPTQATACQYYGSDGKTYFAVGMGDANGAADSGVWLYNIVAGTWANIGTTSKDVVVTSYQSRLITRDDGTGINNNRIAWTDPGGITFPAANFLDLAVNSSDIANQIAAFVPYAPQTLLVATVTGGWYMIDGDITDPVVRQMGSRHQPNLGHGTKMAPTDDGIVFVDVRTGLYRTQNMGAGFDRIDSQLTPYTPPSIIAGYGVTAYKDFIFAPSGRVQDTRTGAWFTLSEGVGATPSDFTHAVPYESGGYASFTSPAGLYAPQFCDSAKINYYSLDEAATAGRYTTYTIKTSPVRDAAGRQMVIREVQVGVDSLNAAATIAVTCGGVTRTSSALGTGKNVVSFLFPARDEYLDVQVVPASNTTAEAPVMEFIRMGARPDGHQIQY